MRRRFLYFLPGVPGCSERALAALGLLDRFLTGGQLGEWSVTAVDRGPSGGSGCIVTASAHPAQYEESLQAWVQGGARWWAGLENPQMPPGPDDLVREIGLEGYEAELCDGRLWRIPKVLRWDAEKLDHMENIPKRLNRVPAGDGRFKFAYEAPEAYRAVLEIARRSFEDHVHERSISIERLFEDAALLLSANYRLGPAEVALLGLFDEGRAQEVMALSFDLPAIQAHAEQMRTQGLMACEPAPDADAMEASHG